MTITPFSAETDFIKRAYNIKPKSKVGMHMKTSTEINSVLKHVGYEKAIELVASAGFDAWDFSMFNMIGYDWEKECHVHTQDPLAGKNYAAFARKLRKIGEDFGIHCNQSHAPFPVYCREIKSYLKRAIECTAIAGGKICVIHPNNFASVEENAEMYRELLPFAKEHGVKIATENMWNWNKEKGVASAAACSHHDNFLAHLLAVNDPYFVACLDIGHAEMEGLNTNAEKMILTLGSHLQALHVHDNDLKHDSHQIPFSMNIDFGAVVRSLKKIGYTGYLTLEADSYLSKYGQDNLFEGVKELQRSAKRLSDMFESGSVQ